ncbi:MAG TPA: transglutaminase domain-containing protein, partial [Actinomycetota bacterium]|nr:transglutaminase domain-containing protein [Actinomycetota bacterium]
TKRYKIDIPPDPPGRDPVDVFVFDRHEGFCEQIAATMSLMLRASGVPSRIATGFGEGERNPFTGYWEVKNSDAHAWVEVFYPDQGWIPYDPTFGVPEASPSNTTFMLEPLARAIGRVIPAGAVVRLTQGLRDALGIAAFIPLLVVAAGVPATFVMRRRRRHRRTVHPGPRGRVVEAWLSLEDALAAVGLERMPHETVREFLPRAAVHPSVDAAELRRLADTFSRVRYGREPGEREAAACEQAAWRIRDALRGARPPVFSTSR